MAHETLPATAIDVGTNVRPPLTATGLRVQASPPQSSGGVVPVPRTPPSAITQQYPAPQQYVTASFVIPHVSTPPADTSDHMWPPVTNTGVSDAANAPCPRLPNLPSPQQ